MHQRRLALVVASCAILADASPSWAQLERSWLQILHPGSRPALGIGSDPFLSPLMDDFGWWARTVTVAPRSIGFETRTDVPFASSTIGDHGTLAATDWAWTVSWEAGLLRRRWQLATRISTPQWEGTWRDGTNAASVRGSSTRVELGLRVPNALPGLVAQVAFPVWSSEDAARRPLFRTGVRYRLRRPGIAFNADVCRTRTPELLRSSLSGAVWDASLNLVSLERRLEAEAALPSTFAIDGGLQRSDLAAESPSTIAPVYHLSPAGRSDSWWVGASWGRRDGVRAVLRWRRGALDMRADADWGGERFGQLNYARADLRSRLAAVQVPVGRRGRALLEYEAVRTDGRARANVETWPFTPTLIDLLGPRRIAKAEFDLPWDRSHVGFEHTVGTSSQLGVGVSWYDLRPGAILVSWQPAFLVFGRADLREDELSLRRLQLMGFSFGGHLRRGSLDLGFHVQQLVPVRIVRRSTAGAPPAVEGPPSDTASSRGASLRDWPSGTTLAVSLTHLR